VATDYATGNSADFAVTGDWTRGTPDDCTLDASLGLGGGRKGKSENRGANEKSLHGSLQTWFWEQSLMTGFVPTANHGRGGHQLRALQTMNAKEYEALSRRRGHPNFRWRWGFDLDRRRFGRRNRFLRFDFLADRCDWVTHFRDNALQIVSGYTKPPS
jgi:hypothetical protein